MRVLITCGSKRGGTEGIARIIGETLEHEGFEVEVLPAGEVGAVLRFDAVIVGGGLYANRWHRAARRFVSRHAAELRQLPVWFFSSGPLDDSARQRVIPPTRQVKALMRRVGAQGHMTFGGRLERDVHGFPASAMAKKFAGDWRDPGHIRSWAFDVSRALPAARPQAAAAANGRAAGVPAVLAHALVGWALCAATMGLGLATATPENALAGHAIAAPILFMVVAAAYFRRPRPFGPLGTALVFTATVALVDLVVVAGLAQHSLAMFRSVAGTWLPFGLIFLVTFLTGQVRTRVGGGHQLRPHAS